MHNSITDAELIETLRVAASGGSRAEQGQKLGISENEIRWRMRKAKERGLTVTTPVVSELDKAKIKVASLQRELAAIQKHNNDAEEIRRVIYKLDGRDPDPPRWLTRPRPAGLPGVPVAFWSDWHWGEVVSKSEVGGVNEFNRDIAKKRLKRLVDITLDLALHHMVNPQYPGLILCLGGDMISGDIHEELADTNDGYIMQCLNEVEDELLAALLVLADKFGKVTIFCVPGNHGRNTLRPRNKGAVYESYEWNLYVHLKKFLKHDRRFSFHIPDEVDIHFKIFDWRFMLTHGDRLGVRGGDGIIGALGPISRGAMKVGHSEAQIGRDFDYLMMGHWHTYIPANAANHTLVNGTLKGYDEFARLSLRVPYSRPSQSLFFVHQKHGITAQWEVFLDSLRQSSDDAPWVSWQEERS